MGELFLGELSPFELRDYPVCIWRVQQFVPTLAETNMGTLRAMAERNMRKDAKRAVLGPNWGRSGCMIRRYRSAAAEGKE